MGDTKSRKIERIWMYVDMKGYVCLLFLFFYLGSLVLLGQSECSTVQCVSDIASLKFFRLL